MNTIEQLYAKVINQMCSTGISMNKSDEQTIRNRYAQEAAFRQSSQSGELGSQPVSGDYPQVTASLNYLATVCEGLEERIKALEARLDGVLVPTEPEQKCVEIDGKVFLAKAISINAQAVQNANRRLESIMNRLQF